MTHFRWERNDAGYGGRKKEKQGTKAFSQDLSGKIKAFHSVHIWDFSYLKYFSKISVTTLYYQIPPRGHFVEEVLAGKQQGEGKWWATHFFQ